MLKHLIPIFIKFVMTAIILEITFLLFSDLTFGNILWISLAITLIAYIIGDMVILPSTNNIVATIADIGLALAIIYLFDYFWNTNDITLLSSLVAVAAIGVGEWFFHKIVNRSAHSEDSDIW